MRGSARRAVERTFGRDDDGADGADADGDVGPTRMTADSSAIEAAVREGVVEGLTDRESGRADGEGGRMDPEGGDSGTTRGRPVSAVKLLAGAIGLGALGYVARRRLRDETGSDDAGHRVDVGDVGSPTTSGADPVTSDVETEGGASITDDLAEGDVERTADADGEDDANGEDDAAAMREERDVDEQRSASGGAEGSTENLPHETGDGADEDDEPTWG